MMMNSDENQPPGSPNLMKSPNSRNNDKISNKRTSLESRSSLILKERNQQSKTTPQKEFEKASAGTSDASVPVASCDTQVPLELPGVVTAAPQPSKPPSSDHEQNITVARNLVEELVNSASHTKQKSFDFNHGDSGGGIIYEHSPLTKFDNDDDFSLCSLSLQSGSSLSLVPSLPDLLQSAKNLQNKNTDTDTDTTEYDTAPETDSASIQDIPFGDLLSNSDFNISELCRDLAKVTLETSTNNLNVTQLNTESSSSIQHDSDSGSFVDCDNNSDNPDSASPSNKTQSLQKTIIVEDESNESFKSTSSFDSIRPNYSSSEQSSNSSKNYDISQNCNETVVLNNLNQTVVIESQNQLQSQSYTSNENCNNSILLNNSTKETSHKDEKGELGSNLPEEVVYDESTEKSSIEIFEDPNKNSDLKVSQSPDLKEEESANGKYDPSYSLESEKECLEIQSNLSDPPGSFSLNSTILISDSPKSQNEEIHNNSIISNQVISPIEIKKNSVISSQNLEDLNSKLINNFELQEEQNRLVENTNKDQIKNLEESSKVLTNSDIVVEEKLVEKSENKDQIKALEETTDSTNSDIGLEENFFKNSENKDQIKTSEESPIVLDGSGEKLVIYSFEQTQNSFESNSNDSFPCQESDPNSLQESNFNDTIKTDLSFIEFESECNKQQDLDQKVEIFPTNTSEAIPIDQTPEFVEKTENKDQIKTLEDSPKVSLNSDKALEEKSVEKTENKDQIETLEDSPKVSLNSDKALEEKSVEKTENKDHIETLQVSLNSDKALEEKLVENTENKDQIETLQVSLNSDKALEEKLVENTDNKDQIETLEDSPKVSLNSDKALEEKSVEKTENKDHIETLQVSLNSDKALEEKLVENTENKDHIETLEVSLKSDKALEEKSVENTENKDQIETLEDSPKVSLNSDKTLEEKLVEKTENKDHIETLEVSLKSDKALEEKSVENTENKDHIETLQVSLNSDKALEENTEKFVEKTENKDHIETLEVSLNSDIALEDKFVENTENKDHIEALKGSPKVSLNSDKALEEKFVEKTENKDHIETLEVSLNSDKALEEKLVENTDSKDQIQVLEDSPKVSLNSHKALEKLVENTDSKDQIETLEDSTKEENNFLTQKEDIKNNTVVEDHNNSSISVKDNLLKDSLTENEKVIQEVENLSTESSSLKQLNNSSKQQQSLDSETLDKNSSINSIKKESFKESPQIKKKEIIQNDLFTNDIQNLTILEDVHLKSDLSENLPKDTRKPNVILVSELLNKTLDNQFKSNVEPLDQSTPKFELKEPNSDQKDSPNKFQIDIETNRKATLVLNEGIFSPFKQISKENLTKSPLPVIQPGEDSFKKLNLVLNSVETEPQFNNILEICKRQQRSLETDEELPFIVDSDFVESEKVFGSIPNTDNTFVLPDFEENRQYQPQAFDFDLISREASRLSLTLKNDDDQLNDGVKSANSMADAIGSSATYTKRGSARGVSPAANEDPFSPKSRLHNSPPRRSSVDRKSYPRANTKVESLEPDLISSNSEIINQSEAGPETAAAVAASSLGSSDNAFKDPSAFEFLSSVGNSRSLHLRDLRKESLYVKFDPLVGNNPISQPASADIDNKSKRNTLKEELNANECHSQLNSSRLINHTIEEGEKSLSSTPRKNPAIDLIDKLILLSPSPIKEPAAGATGSQTKDSHTQATPIKDREPNINIKQFESIIGDNNKMKEELELVRELLTKQEKDYQVALEEKEKLINSLAQKNKDLEERENQQAKINERMKIFLKEYEKSISNLTAEKEYDKQMYEADKDTLVKDKEQAMGHLEAIEIAFADLHKKYERAKSVIDGFKKNEEVLKLHLVESKETITEQEKKYELFKTHVFSQLESANQELDATKRTHQGDIAKLGAKLKKSEIKISSLQEMLEQKVKENTELANICDELIAKVN